MNPSCGQSRVQRPADSGLSSVRAGQGAVGAGSAVEATEIGSSAEAACCCLDTGVRCCGADA